MGGCRGLNFLSGRQRSSARAVPAARSSDLLLGRRDPGPSIIAGSDRGEPLEDAPPRAPEARLLPAAAALERSWRRSPGARVAEPSSPGLNGIVLAATLAALSASARPGGRATRPRSS